MRDWIVGLQKGAAERGEGLDPQEWASLEEAAGLQVPAELKDLYEAMNGAKLEAEVALASFRGDKDPGVLEHSQRGSPGLPPRGTWIFGHREGSQPLFSVSASALREHGARAPDWLGELGEDDWVFGIHRGEDDVRFYRSLEQLLARLVPPVQTEEFGDSTYARALTAVQGALDGLEEGDEELTPVVPATRARRPEPRRTEKSGPAPKTSAKAKAKPKAKPKPKPKPKASKSKAKPARKSTAGKPKKKPARSSPRRAGSKQGKKAVKSSRRVKKAPARKGKKPQKRR